MAPPAITSQWRVGIVVGTEFKNWRRPRVQDNTTSWISRSPTFVSSRMLKEVFSFGGDVTGLVPPNVLKRLRSRMGKG